MITDLFNQSNCTISFIDLHCGETVTAPTSYHINIHMDAPNQKKLSRQQGLPALSWTYTSGTFNRRTFEIERSQFFWLQLFTPCSVFFFVPVTDDHLNANLLNIMWSNAIFWLHKSMMVAWMFHLQWICVLWIMEHLNAEIFFCISDTHRYTCESILQMCITAVPTKKTHFWISWLPLR